MDADRHVGGWTVETALAHVKGLIEANDKGYAQRFKEQKDAVDAALTAVKEQTKASFASSEKAIEKAETNAEKWRQNANEWRAAMVDRENRFASRLEAENEFKNIRKELADLRSSRDIGSGRGAGASALWGYIAAAIAILIALLSLIVKVGGP
jgi:hypothetical protein